MVKLNIRESLRAFIFSPRNTARHSLIRYVLVPVLNRVKRLDCLPNQLELIKELVQQDRFTLIVLDACRYDVFRRIYEGYLSGKLIEVKSVGSNTFEWMPKIFSLPEFREVRVFSAHPAINSLGVRYGTFRATDFLAEKNIIDVWKTGWNDSFKTVLPKEINQSVKEHGLDDKNLIWYMQPHFPWICQRELSTRLIQEYEKSTRTRKLPMSWFFMERVTKGMLSREQVARNYILNLRSALRYVSKLIEEIRGNTDRIVVTSDHGELLGEYGLYIHSGNLHLPELVNIMWFSVN